MAAFCNQFDKVCTELECAVIYCHHHSKGAQGGKRSMDRASGSGVFARDPDALLDMIELDLNEDIRKQQKNAAVCELCGSYLERYGKAGEVSQDDLCSGIRALEACEDLLTAEEYGPLFNAVTDAENAVDAATAWRIEATLREFPKPPPLNVWFKFPVHSVDTSGVLSDIQPEAAEPWKRKKASKDNLKKSSRAQGVSIIDSMDTATAYTKVFDFFDGVVTVTEFAKKLKVNKKTLSEWIDKHPEKFTKDETGNVLKTEG